MPTSTILFAISQFRHPLVGFFIMDVYIGEGVKSSSAGGRGRKGGGACSSGFLFVTLTLFFSLALALCLRPSPWWLAFFLPPFISSLGLEWLEYDPGLPNPLWAPALNLQSSSKREKGHVCLCQCRYIPGRFSSF